MPFWLTFNARRMITDKLHLKYANITVIWNNSKIKSLFSLKDKVKHVSFEIYAGIRRCDENYIILVKWTEFWNMLE